MPTDDRPAPGLATAALTDVGRLREHNEDALLVRRVGDWTLLCVADGLGGHARGEWASARALEVFGDALEAAVAAEMPEDALRTAAAVANSTIHHEALEIGAPGAATTLVAALVGNRTVWWLNVGDSRLYLQSGGVLRQVSEDHSWVAERVREGVLPVDALRTHPHRNVVTRTVGFEPEVEPGTGSFELVPGDVLLLCSDGLFGPVPESRISQALSGDDLPGVARELVDLANGAAGPDNITVVVARYLPA